MSIEFDRAKMQNYLFKFLAIFLGVLMSAISAMALILSHVAATGWPKFLVTFLTCFVAVQVMDFVQYVGSLSRGLRKKTPAVVVNRAGIVDNASQFALGQLAWGEIERMYPCDCKSHLLANRWTKMPVIFKERGIAIILKENADLQHLIEDKPQFVRWLSREWYRPGKRRWVFVPEMVLPVTANDLMEQINKFYVTQVRGY